MDWREKLLHYYYRSLPAWQDGTTRFHNRIQDATDASDVCLEIGAGPTNPTSRFLSRHFSAVDGADIDPDVRSNEALRKACVYDGDKLPLDDANYDCVVANFVLEHVEEPKVFLAEIYRVLKPGGCFVFRTPNRWHYVSIAACLVPNRLHDWIARRTRNLPADAHEAYPTFHRMNARRRLMQLSRQAGFDIASLQVYEFEPSYMMFHPLAFRLGVLYERTVNRFVALAGLRANIFGVMGKSSTAVQPEGASTSTDRVAA